MPIYEYECQECGKVFEKLQSFSDPLEDTCPDCGGPVKKLVSKSTRALYNGSGYYITDYGRNNQI